MGKADADRDYYGDLELDPSADANEIKKAFKKLALKYHPDRNPGKEVEYNAKFQAIQSANEVLTDPQQRAKYDAQRIRSGLFHTYANASSPPSRPTVPTRAPASGFSNFPPPPRPPPPPKPKSNFPPHPSGAQKYSNVRFDRPETATSGSSTNSDNTRSKTNDYKAWEQMRARHGQGPIPNGRTVPPKASKASPFPPAREPPSATPAGTTPRRSHWEQFQESQAGMPGMARANTTRASPTRPKFAPRTPGGDEPQAQGSSYFKVSRDERSTASKPQTRMPPPPPPPLSPVPTAKKPDPLRPFRDQEGLNEPFGKMSHASSHYQKGRHDSIPGAGLHRSATLATPRDSNVRKRFAERGPAGTSNVRAASVSSNRHGASPPNLKGSKLPEMYSSSSSSASSSGDEGPQNHPNVYAAPLNSKQPRVPNSEQSRRRFNLYANAGDEGMAPQASFGGGYNGIRRHSAVDLSTDNPPEGFQEHRKKHDAERSQQHSTEDRNPAGSPAPKSSQPPLARSQSWQERYKQDHQEKWGSPPRDKKDDSTEGGQAAKTPMYESRGYNLFSSPPSCGPPSSETPNSDKWSDQWPFKSPKKPRAATAGPPPYWAIPSSLPPPRETESRKRAKTHTPSRFNIQNASIADSDPFYRFNLPQYANAMSARIPPLRSQSSDHIDTKFSPEGWHGKFFEPPASRAATPLRNVSPTERNAAQQQQPATTQQVHSKGFNPAEDSSATPRATAPPPPPRGQEQYHEERWRHHLNDIKFDVPQSSQTSSPTRQNTRKRARARGPKSVSAQPTVNDVEDEPTADSNTGESLESSKANSDIDPMDIDEPTPPKNANADQLNGNTSLPAQSNGTTHPARRVPTLPPRKNLHTQAQTDRLHLNLGDLKNVYPFAPSNEGLGNMNDIATNLPFESKASPTKPVTDGSLERVDFPQPPLGPKAPSSLTDTSCDRFCRQVHNYMEEWYVFTVKMANLLSAKRMFNMDNSSFGLMDIEDNGYDDYMKGLEESRRARVHFDVACEKHYKIMQDLGLVRQEMKRGRGGVPV